MKSILILLFLCWVRPCCSQNPAPANIFHRMIGDRIEIFYDLPRNTDTLEVVIWFRKKSDPGMKYRLRYAKGSIGNGVFSGKRQKVVWLYKKEPPHLFTGSGFYYEVHVRKLNQAP